MFPCFHVSMFPCLPSSCIMSMILCFRNSANGKRN
jgi:hypothetical protein